MLLKKNQIETLNAMKMILAIWVIAGPLSRNICDSFGISIVQILKYLYNYNINIRRYQKACFGRINLHFFQYS